jgi:aquaporin Z
VTQRLPRPVPEERGPPERTGPASVPSPQPATGGWHFVEWLCELAGTAALIFGGLSAVTLIFHPGWTVVRLVPSEPLRLLLAGSAFGVIIILVAVSPLGRRSGAHLNPAVTLAFRCTGHVHPHDLAGYCAGQFAGALLGAALLRATWGQATASIDHGALHPHVGALPALVWEAGMTAALVLTLFASLSSRRTARWTPVAVALAVAVLVWLGGRATGAGFNPARTVGPAIVAGDYRSFWVYIVGPIGGALLAAAVWEVVPWVALTAKLFHDPRYPSVARTDLPALPATPSRPPGG